jgi:hypothetical protein
MHKLHRHGFRLNEASRRVLRRSFGAVVCDDAQAMHTGGSPHGCIAERALAHSFDYVLCSFYRAVVAACYVTEAPIDNNCSQALTIT